MKQAILIIFLLLIAVAGAWYWSVRTDQRELEQVRVLPPSTPAPVPEPQPIKHPVEDIVVPLPAEPQPEPEPVLSLEDSDAVVMDELAGLVGIEALEQYFFLELIISRVVATIDSLPSANVTSLMLPVKPVAGEFMVLSVGEQAAINPLNAERYEPYVELAQSVDTSRLVALYVRYYPLFQESYEALGYPDAYFNDRLVEVIDHLLEAPKLPELIAVQPLESVYIYEIPELEALSAGQKTLLRLGPEHSQAIKAKLREVRAEISGEVMVQ